MFSIFFLQNFSCYSSCNSFSMKLKIWFCSLVLYWYYMIQVNDSIILSPYIFFISSSNFRVRPEIANFFQIQVKSCLCFLSRKCFATSKILAFILIIMPKYLNLGIKMPFIHISMPIMPKCLFFRHFWLPS